MSSGAIYTEPPDPSHAPVINEPAWDLALLYPMQGHWSHEDYLQLTDGTNRLIEFTRGQIEVLPVPTIEHQLIMKYLLKILDQFVDQRQLGIALCAGTRVYLEPDKYREPDIVFNFAAKHARSGKRYYRSADLVMEIVSDDPNSKTRDWEKKVADYAAGGIAEYRVVDPQAQLIVVHTLEGHSYKVHGTFRDGESVTSKLLEGFAVEVGAVFAAGRV
ncbi:Uma2 family endonuclease [Anatilimnocola floriformis]|uniref:Uma2 family endonuclease n=1 Tax=Anatilimnocola floriformis TaxID=2948575 RepID=UPI0020C25A17|nr:Uma2 family endonuclease [Anatilimnocola floriformis]